MADATTLRSHWESIWEKNKDYYHEFLLSDPFAKWERSTMPETLAEGSLFRGIQILMLKNRHPCGLACLHRSRRIVERALDENTCRAKRCASRYPFNLARLMRSLAVAEFVENSRMEVNYLRQASELFVQGATIESPYINTDYNQAHYLAGVRAAILTGEIGAAQKLIHNGPTLSFHNLEADALRAICDNPVGANKEALERKLTDLLLSARDPRQKRDVFTERDALAFDIAWILTSTISSSGVKASSDVVLSRLID